MNDLPRCTYRDDAVTGGVLDEPYWFVFDGAWRIETWRGEPCAENIVSLAVALTLDDATSFVNELNRLANRADAAEARIAELEKELIEGRPPSPDCPADHGQQCCGYPDLCRAALTKETPDE